MTRLITILLIAAGLLALGLGEARAQGWGHYPGSLCQSTSPNATVVGPRIENKSTKTDILVSCPVVKTDFRLIAIADVWMFDGNQVHDISCTLKSEWRYGVEPRVYGFSTAAVTSRYPVGAQNLRLAWSFDPVIGTIYNAVAGSVYFIECKIPAANVGTSGIDSYHIFWQY